MRRYNKVSWIPLILTVTTFALAVPVLVQDKRQAWVNEVHVPEDVVTMLGKRVLDEELNVLWNGLHWQHMPLNVLGETPVALPPNVPPLEQNLAHIHMSPASSTLGSDSDADSVQESIHLDDEAPPASPKSGYSHSPPTSPKSEYSHSPPTSPGWSTKSEAESEDWYTAPSSLKSSESGSESDLESDRWPMDSNAPSAKSQPENLKAGDTEMKGKATVEGRISGTASDFDTVNAAQMELRSAVVPGPFPPKLKKPGSGDPANPILV